MSASGSASPQVPALPAPSVCTERREDPGEYGPDWRTFVVEFDVLYPESLLFGGARSAASLFRLGGVGYVHSVSNLEHRAQFGSSREHFSWKT